jgi:hypothetical protein
MSGSLAYTQQRGQAAFEALLIIGFSFTLALGIHHLGQLRLETLALLGESHFLSFGPTNGLDEINISVGPRLSDRYAGVRLSDSPYSAQQREIENQLGFDSTTLLRASAASDLALHSRLPIPDPIKQALLVRHSFLLSGSGQANSTQAAQRQIAGSAALWQESFSRSKQLVSASAIGLQNIDRPWGRPTLTSDWLLPWADETMSPGQFRQASAVKQTKIIPQFANTLFK